MGKTVIRDWDFDSALAVKKIQGYLLVELVAAEPKFIDLMQQEIRESKHGDGPGKPDWRDETAAAVKAIYDTIGNTYIEMSIGPDLQANSFEAIRAMVVEAGAGSAVGNPPIQAGPFGRTVFNDDLDGVIASQVKVPYLLPTTYNQEGNHFVSDTIKRAESYLKNVFDQAW